MDDNELLELAAKAAEIDLMPQDHGHCVEFHRRIMQNADSILWTTWNPLADDGDALRLVVKLRMLVEVWHDEVRVTTTHRATGNEDISEPVGVDLHSATRRAIVRAAAELGMCASAAVVFTKG